MTNTSSSIRRYNALVGLLGEYLAAAELRQLGATVQGSVFGGQRCHHDQDVLTATGRPAWVSVKTSTRGDGALAFQRPGMETVTPWVATAAAAGAQAIVLGLHVEPAGPVQPVPGGFFFPTPRVLEVGALDAETWGRRVDAARAAYGARPRKDGRGLLSADALRYPMTVHEMAWLHDVLR